MCTGELLDMAENMQTFLKDANVSDIDPAPHLRVIDNKMRHKSLSENLNDLKLSKNHITGIEQKFTQLKPRAELTMLETKKYLRSGETLKQQSSGQLSASTMIRQKSAVLEQGISDLVNELRNYDIGGVSPVDIQRALVECGVLLRYIKNQQTFTELDIRARTELSHARQSLKILKDIIYVYARKT